MKTLDLWVIAAYFVLTLALGLWVSRGAKSGDDYFLGARDLPAWAVMLSIVATETSALTVISIPGIGARGDFTFLQLAMGYIVGRMGVAWWLLPGYFSGQQQTAYERLQTRFGAPTRQALSLVFIVTRFLADAVRIFAGAIPLALVTGWSIPWAIVAMGSVTLLYTCVGGLKAVVWADALQLGVYVAGGVAALWIAAHMAGGMGAVWDAAAAQQKIQAFDWRWSLSEPYTFFAALIGGAMLSAASHGADHIIVQRLLATRGLRDAQWALVGSGFLVFLQFALFLAVGTAVWASGHAPPELAGDQIFSRFIVNHLPAGIAGMVVAAILAAAMSTISSSISALASSMTNDLYAPYAKRRDTAHLLRVGKAFSIFWGLLLMGGALGFYAMGSQKDTPVVVVALSIASVTYGTLLGALIASASPWPTLQGKHVCVGAAFALSAMMFVVFAKALSPVWPALTPLASLAWPWYVPLGTLLCLMASFIAQTGLKPRPRKANL